MPTKPIDPDRNWKTLEAFVRSVGDEEYAEEWAPYWAKNEEDPLMETKAGIARRDHGLSVMAWRAAVAGDGMTQEQLAMIGAHMLKRMLGNHTKWCSCPAAKALRSQVAVVASAKRLGRLGDGTETRTLEERYGIYEQTGTGAEKKADGHG